MSAKLLWNDDRDVGRGNVRRGRRGEEPSRKGVHQAEPGEAY